VVVVYGVISKHGYDGLLIATTIAGGLLIAAGILWGGRDHLAVIDRRREEAPVEEALALTAADA
jgi:hypothetical protein